MAKNRTLKAELDSLFNAMHEAYRDCDEQKSKILATIRTKKLDIKPEDNEEKIMVANFELNGYKLINDVIDKKVKLLAIHGKLFAGRVMANKDEISVTDQKYKHSLSAEEMDVLALLAKEQIKTNQNYDLTE